MLYRFALKALALLCLMAAWMPPSAEAHESRPAYLQIRETGPGRYDVLWRTPVNSGMPLPVLLQLPEAAKNMADPVIQRLNDSTVERRRIELPDGAFAGQRIDFVGLQATITDVLVRVSWLDGRQATEIVRPAHPWVELSDRQTTWQVARTYTTLGIEHILFGFDHLLFVAALMLIVRSWRTLVKTITAFTVAHSITLTFATMGWIALPSGPVETMIALSIVLIAVEIIRMERGQTGLTIDWPWIVAFAFGLLHGFGFAGALADIGLPQGDIPLALFCFNLGVEIGQLMFVAVMLMAFAALRRIVDVPQRAIIASAYIIGTVAAFWSIERLQAMFA